MKSIVLRPYLGNPLKEENEIAPARCGFRSIVFNKVYHIFEEGITGGRWRIYKRISKDGYTVGSRSTALFPFGAKGVFDEFGQADPTVIYDGDWNMWFDAMDSATFWSFIGHATSKDGDKWINKGPVLGRGAKGEWDCQSVHHPCCIKYNGTYYLYYSGSDGTNIYNVKHIGLATAKDGVNWTKEKSNPVVLHGNDKEWDSKYVRPSKPIFINDRWFMFYWGYNGIHSMGLAESTDLIHWKKLGKLISGRDNHTGITASETLYEGNKIRIWYKMFNNWQLNTGEITYEYVCNSSAGL